MGAVKIRFDTKRTVALLGVAAVVLAAAIVLADSGIALPGSGRAALDPITTTRVLESTDAPVSRPTAPSASATGSLVTTVIPVEPDPATGPTQPATEPAEDDDDDDAREVITPELREEDDDDHDESDEKPGEDEGEDENEGEGE